MAGKTPLSLTIAAAKRVHRRLGPGHGVAEYNRALRAELQRAGLRVLSRPAVRVHGKYGHSTYLGSPDLLVRNGRREALLVSVSAAEHVPLDRRERMGLYLAAWRGPARGLVLAFGAPLPLWTVVRKEENR